MQAGTSRAARQRNTPPEIIISKEKGAEFGAFFVRSGHGVQTLFLQLFQQRHFGGGQRDALGE